MKRVRPFNACSVQTPDRLDPLPVFSAGGRCDQFWHGQGCPLFDVVHPVFPLPTMQGDPPRCPEGGFGEAVVAQDMPEPCEFPSLDSYQKRLPWTHKEVGETQSTESQADI